MVRKAIATVVGLGELLWDCYADSRRPGGAPANVAFHAQQLGHRGVICSRIGEDTLGQELLDYMAGCGLDTRHIQKDTERPTGWVSVDTTHPEKPLFVIHENVAWDHLTFTEAVEGLMTEASAVCFGTLAQRGPQSRETIHRCLEAARDAILVYDVNLRQEWYQREWIERSLAASDIVKLNVDEVAVLSDVLGTGSLPPVEFADILLERYGLEWVCVTRAELGCLLFGGGSAYDEPGARVEVADAVGAGDAFTAALISSRLRGWSLSTTAWFANQVGALVATRPGAMPSLEAELARVISDAENQESR